MFSSASASLAPDQDVSDSTAPDTLLIVDDDELARETLGWHFRSSGYAVTLAGTGEGALRQAQITKADCVVVDHHLPDMTGLQCLRRLRDTIDNAQSAVLLFTADWDVEEEAETIAGLGAMFASKLCDLDELQRLIRALLAMRASFGARANAVSSGGPDLEA